MNLKINQECAAEAPMVHLSIEEIQPKTPFPRVLEPDLADLRILANKKKTILPG